MDQSELINLQYEMKQNNEELQDFLRDLDSWQKDIKVKDQKLKGEKTDNTQDSLPPVRNSLEKKKKKKRVKPKKSAGTAGKPESDPEKSVKVKSTYDYYRKWDNSDVDKACDDVDVEEEESSESEYETDEEAEAEKRQQRALVCKDRGNQLFKEGKLNEAVESYTEGMAADPYNAVLPANRAMALLKLDRFGAAEADCTASISLDAGYVKAYHRRATARAELNKLHETRQDLQRVLQLEPNNRRAEGELRKIVQILNPEVRENAGIVKPIHKSPQERSKKPLVRVEIEEVGVEDSRQVAPPAGKVDSTSHEQFKRFLPTSGKDSGKDHVTSGTENTTSGAEHVTSGAEHVTSGAEHMTSGTERLSLNSGRSAPQEDENEATNKQKETTSTPDTSPRLPPVPTTSYQFHADWKALRNHPEKQYHYLKAIDPVDFAGLLGESLEASTLNSILTIVKDFYISDGVDPYPVLLNLTHVKRFSFITMFMSHSEKQVLKTLFDALRAKNEHSTSDVKHLEKLYQI